MLVTVLGGAVHRLCTVMADLVVDLVVDLVTTLGGEAHELLGFTIVRLSRMAFVSTSRSGHVGAAGRSQVDKCTDCCL